MLPRRLRDLFGRTSPAPAALAVDTTGILAAAHAAVGAAGIARLSDDDDGPRFAVACDALGNPLWRYDCAEEMGRRVSKAWPDLPADQVADVLAHLANRVMAVAQSRPIDRQRQEDLSRAGRNWVQNWRLDQHDGVIR